MSNENETGNEANKEISTPRQCIQIPHKEFESYAWDCEAHGNEMSCPCGCGEVSCNHITRGKTYVLHRLSAGTCDHCGEPAKVVVIEDNMKAWLWCDICQIDN
jgi:hypothetical protein